MKDKKIQIMLVLFVQRSHKSYLMNHFFKKNEWNKRASLNSKVLRK